MISYGLLLAALAASANAYWLMGIEDFITTERIDPVVSAGKISGHVHSVLGGSNFRFTTNTASLRESECTSIPIPQDKSNYWFPHLYFQWKNGSFTSLDGGAVIYYLFSDTPGTTTAFPDDFRMLSGDPSLRTYDPSSFAQQAVTFLCLDFNGQSTKHNALPLQSCPSGIRVQINFPSCWDGKNTDSSDHKSHVTFPSGGPDSGTCSDPKFPVTLPRIFMELYWGSNTFDSVRDQAMNTTQPFVFSYGDRTGYGYHADFINGWDAGVLQKAVDQCHCNPYGDPTCCAQQGIFDLNQGKTCRITKSIDEQTTGTLPKLPGNNPVQEEGQRATMFADTSSPALIAPVFAYTGSSPTQTGQIVSGSAPTGGNLAVVSSDAPVATSSAAVVSSAVVASSATAAASSHGGTTSSVVAAPASSTAAGAVSSAAAAPASSSFAGAASSASAVAGASVIPPAHASSAAAAPASSSPAGAASSAAVAAGTSVVPPVQVASSTAAAPASSSPAGAASSAAAADGTSVVPPAQAASSAAAAASSSAAAHHGHQHGSGQSQQGSSSNNSSSSPASSAGSCKRKERRSPISRRFASPEPEPEAKAAPVPVQKKRNMHRARYSHDSNVRNTF